MQLVHDDWRLAPGGFVTRPVFLPVDTVNDDILRSLSSMRSGNLILLILTILSMTELCVGLAQDDAEYAHRHDWPCGA